MKLAISKLREMLDEEQSKAAYVAEQIQQHHNTVAQLQAELSMHKDRISELARAIRLLAANS